MTAHVVPRWSGRRRSTADWYGTQNRAPDRPTTNAAAPTTAGVPAIAIAAIAAQRSVAARRMVASPCGGPTVVTANPRVAPSVTSR